ncbi:Uncharacterized protein APZ42_029480 [Daphnia magna]|uniref:Uncharacterized protein n=1 Tax=Daphnia magna TaxID=35525 RepID=A0A0P6A806_9CRUS|nr:Uncharacterized protein APZ42_029480 [Daphnia magna]
MLTHSAAIFLALLIGSLTTTVTCHWKNSKLAGSHGHLMGTKGERCPPGMRLVVGTHSPGLLAGNFAAMCEPWHNGIVFPHGPSNTFIQPNAAFVHPAGIFNQPLHAASTGVVGHHWAGLQKGFVSKGLSLKSALHAGLGSKFSKHAIKHSLKSKF